MSAPVEWQIPPSVLRWLARVPHDAPVALLLRHSVRDQLAMGDAGYRQPITDIGATLARDLGAILGDRLRSLHTSPLTRCIQTAEALRAPTFAAGVTGAGCPITPRSLAAGTLVWVADLLA